MKIPTLPLVICAALSFAGCEDGKQGEVQRRPMRPSATARTDSTVTLTDAATPAALRHRPTPTSRPASASDADLSTSKRARWTTGRAGRAVARRQDLD